MLPFIHFKIKLIYDELFCCKISMKCNYPAALFILDAFLLPLCSRCIEYNALLTMLLFIFVCFEEMPYTVWTEMYSNCQLCMCVPTREKEERNWTVRLCVCVFKDTKNCGSTPWTLKGNQPSWWSLLEFKGMKRWTAYTCKALRRIWETLEKLLLEPIKKIKT